MVQGCHLYWVRIAHCQGERMFVTSTGGLPAPVPRAFSTACAYVCGLQYRARVGTRFPLYAKKDPLSPYPGAPANRSPLPLRANRADPHHLPGTATVTSRKIMSENP